jgi:hypothetical protein
MNNATKSALLSGLVFPGAGHFYLKKYRAAGVLISITFASLYFITIEVIKQVKIVVKEIEASGFVPGAEEIRELATQAANNASTTETSVASTLIVICWLVGIADGYRSGRLADKSQDN